MTIAPSRTRTRAAGVAAVAAGVTFIGVHPGVAAVDGEQVWGTVTRRVLVGPDGPLANRPSHQAAVFANGRYVALESSVSNLLPGASNHPGDVFVRDRLADPADAEIARGPGAGRTDVVAVDVAATAGLARRVRTWQATAVDFDRDGDQDVWIGKHARGGTLWRNNGFGHYRRSARAAWPERNDAGEVIDRHHCAWADVDRNGLPDAYCTTGRFDLNVVKQRRDNELWLQTRRGRFREVGTPWGVGDACGRGRHAKFLDANGDRFPDLFLGNETPRPGPDRCNRPRNGLPNERSKLFLNTGGHGFRYVPARLRVPAGPGTRCAEKLDFDGDGWDDLFTCREWDRKPRLYRNRRGHGFVDVTERHGLHQQLTDTAVGDLDGDGNPDLISSARERLYYYSNEDGVLGAAHPIEVNAGGGLRSVAVGDADGDGDLDIYVLVAAAPGAPNPDDVILLNDGLTFTPVPVPSADGTASEVTALTPGPAATTAFLVLNGNSRISPGRIQLIRIRS